MSFELSRKEQADYLDVARKAAAQVSRDDQVIGEAADVAVTKLQEHWDHVSTGEKQRRAWVAVVARNEARRVGAKLHRELAMGRAGSLPPPMHDEQEDERVEFLIAEMRSPAGARASVRSSPPRSTSTPHGRSSPARTACCCTRSTCEASRRSRSPKNAGSHRARSTTS